MNLGSFVTMVILTVILEVFFYFFSDGDARWRKSWWIFMLAGLAGGVYFVDYFSGESAPNNKWAGSVGILALLAHCHVFATAVSEVKGRIIGPFVSYLKSHKKEKE